MTIEEESGVVAEITEMTEDLYKAARFSRAFRSIAEAEVDKETQKIHEALTDFLGPNYQNPNAKYATRIPKNASKPK